MGAKPSSARCARNSRDSPERTLRVRESEPRSCGCRRRGVGGGGARRRRRDRGGEDRRSASFARSATASGTGQRCGGSSNLVQLRRVAADSSTVTRRVSATASGPEAERASLTRPLAWLRVICASVSVVWLVMPHAAGAREPLIASATLDSGRLSTRRCPHVPARSPDSFHGKEGFAGSSPAEGFAEPAHRDFRWGGRAPESSLPRR